jgi:hypothetical protein
MLTTVKLRAMGLLTGLFVGILAIGLTVGACGDDDGDENGAATTPGVDSDLSADPGEGSEEIVIKTDVDIHIREGEALPGSSISTGEVVGGSSIGDSPFCPGGTFRDQHGNTDIGLVDRTFRCPDGSLRIGFTPGVPQGRTQAGPWKVLSGTGAFDGLEADGQMEVKYEPGTGATEGRETFTGTVVP